MTRPGPSPTAPAARYVRAAGEAVLLTLAVLSPWAFACAEPPFEAALSAGVLLLAALWAAHAALTGRAQFRPDVVTVCLAGLALWSALHLVPLPESVVGVLSPQRLGWHHTLIPEHLEALPGESPLPRPAWLPLTVDPSATRTFLARVLGVLVAYAAARNWLATRASFPRLAWALAGNGVALAVFSVGYFLAAPRGFVYWTIPVDTDPYGPFICRNHYPDYLALCAGLGIGLLLPRRNPDPEADAPKLITPRTIALAAAVGLMLASIPFSLSRGGVLAVAGAAVGAGLLARGRGGAGLLAVGLAAAAGVAVAAWLGTDAIEKRLATVGSGQAIQSRWPLWRDAARLVPGSWLTGTGGGTFGWVEPTTRTWGYPQAVAENAHNDYLEALVEGGVVRCALTVALAAGVLVVVGRGFRRRRDRSAGPWLLGAWFGLAVVALHAAGDFAVHMPAIAVTTAAVAGYAMAAAVDPGFVPTRLRKAEGETKAPGTGGGSGTGTDRSFSPSPTLLFSPSVLMPFLAAGVALFVALEVRDRARGERLRVAAARAGQEQGLAARAALLDQRAAIRSDDPDALADAAQGHIDLAVEETWATGAAAAGAAAGFSAYPERVPASVVKQQLAPALRQLRAARAANPLAPRPQARLAVYAGYFASADPPGAYFDRAKRLLPGDPEVWFASGKAALARGDEPAAWADWRRSLALSRNHLRPILRAARTRLSPADLRRQLLPDDPALLLAAADELFPDRAAQAAERRPFAEAAADLAGRGEPTPDRLLVLAAADTELGKPDEAGDALRRAVAMAPDRADVRDRYAAWLEQEERYDEAVSELEWLMGHGRSGGVLQDRLDAARHGQKLQRAIKGE